MSDKMPHFTDDELTRLASSQDYPMMAELAKQLAQALEEEGNANAQVITWMADYDKVNKQLAAAQERIMALEAERRWINCQDKLPHADEGDVLSDLVLVWTCYQNTAIDYYDFSHQRWYGFRGDEHVLYWMPLPEPPAPAADERAEGSEK
jgi:hypothetical protein